MKVFGIVGWKNSGKTTLIERLIPCLAARGLSVATLKHAHHAFDIDREGKDSWRHRKAGAREVIVASANRWALMHELHDEPEPSVDDLLARLSPVDLAIVEGYKRHTHPKIEVIRERGGDAPLFATDRDIVAVATDLDDLATALPILPLGRPEEIAAFIVAALGLP